MVWSLANTIATASEADNHTALVYLFDTYLNSKSQFSVNPHPDASAFKRQITCTVNDNIYGGTYSFYNWVTWADTTPIQFTWYEDATYTTVPGDLCTDTTNAVVNGNSIWGTVFGNWRFWTSSLDANACLVTIGKKIIFYWPGGNAWNVYSQSGLPWDGTPRDQTHIFPYSGGSTIYYSNKPGLSATSTNEYVLILNPPINNTVVDHLGGKDVFWKSPTWVYTASTGVGAYWSSYSLEVVQVASDQAMWMSPSFAGSPFPLNAGGGGQLLLLNGTEWWFCPSSAVYSPLCFYMGASEPDMS